MPDDSKRRSAKQLTQLPQQFEKIEWSAGSFPASDKFGVDSRKQKPLEEEDPIPILTVEWDGSQNKGKVTFADAKDHFNVRKK